MKKLILWIIRAFKLDIPTEKVIERVVEREVYLPQKGIISGDIVIKGDVKILGNVDVQGSLSCYSLQEG